MTSKEFDILESLARNKGQVFSKGRTSVLEKLHRKQKEIAIRSGKQQPEQVMGADIERNRK